MLDLLCAELELRLSGARPSEASSSSSAKLPTLNPGQPNVTPNLPRDGVCFHGLASLHGYSPAGEDDDHGLCLCQLTACLGCFHETAKRRKGPISPLPYDLVGTSVAAGWTGAVESEYHSRARRDGMRQKLSALAPLPEGKGFVRNPKPTTNGHSETRSQNIFPHPQMTDVLAVEEHLRWRLKEMGATDPAVESRYGPSTNAPAALEGIDLSEDISEDGSVKGGTGNGKAGKVVKVTRGKGKVRRVVSGSGKKGAEGKEKGRICYLPKEWAEEEPGVRNTALVLTFRHFVKVGPTPSHEFSITSDFDADNLCSCCTKRRRRRRPSSTLPTSRMSKMLSMFTPLRCIDVSQSRV